MEVYRVIITSSVLLMASLLAVFQPVLSSSLTSADSASRIVGTFVGSGPAFPVERNGWKVYWEVTADDGIRIFNVYFKGVLLVRDARLPGILNEYYDSPCFFYNELRSNALPINQIHVEDLTNGSLEPSEQGFQIRADYDSAAYDWQQIWRFYPEGKFLALFEITGGGCNSPQEYEVRWRLDFSIGVDSRNSFQAYDGVAWRPVRLESELLDEGHRDPAGTYTSWKVTSGRRAYLLSTYDSRSPEEPGKILVVRNHDGEIENSRIPGVVTPYLYLNEENVWRRDISIWYVSTHYAPNSYGYSDEPLLTGLVFYPSGF